MIGLFISGALGRVSTLLRTIPPLWLAIALCAAVAAFCWHGWAKSARALEACQTGRATDRKAYTDAQAEAARFATEQKRATEARYAAIEKDKTDEIARAHDANRAALARWMRDAAAKGNQFRSNLSPVTSSAQGTDGPVATSFVVDADDLTKCTDAFTVAEGWQSWWNAVSEGAK